MNLLSKFNTQVILPGNFIPSWVSGYVRTTLNSNVWLLFKNKWKMCGCKYLNKELLFFSNQEAGSTYNVSGQLHSNNSSNFEYSWLMNNRDVEKKLQNPFQSSSVRSKKIQQGEMICNFQSQSFLHCRISLIRYLQSKFNN